MQLTSAEKTLIKNIMDALIPEGDEAGRFPWSAGRAGALETAEDMLYLLPFATGLSIRAAAWAIELMGPLLGLKRLRRFSGLDQSQREQCLAAMSSSRIFLARQMVLLMKSIACLAWGGDERVREALCMNQPPRFIQRQT